MKINSALVLAAGLVAAWQAPQVLGADIIGTITLKGTPPAERPITFLKDDVNCGKLVTDMPTTHFYVVGAKGELADVIVMLKNPPGKSTGAAATPAVLDQKNCTYTPPIQAIQTGQKLLIRNSDPPPILHNVHAVPATDGNKGKNNENQAQASGMPDITMVFPAPENFMKFQCDVHSGPSGSWMLAWVTVIDHPFFSVSDKDGTFKIRNVPPGKYKIAALHRKAAPAGVEQEIEVKEGAPTTVDFTLEVPAAK
jgi:hypothetical protein